MAITHNIIVTGTNDGTKQVSKDAWNDNHIIGVNTIIPNPNIADNSDNTKDIQFTLSGATTAKTLTLISAHTDNRSVTFPNENTTLIGTTDTATVTNKSIDSDNNTITNIVNADIKSTAAIALSKLAALTSAQIIVGNGSNVATAVAITGDISITNAGVVSLSTGVVSEAEMGDATISSGTVEVNIL